MAINSPADGVETSSGSRSDAPDDELAHYLQRFEPPAVALRLTATGPGSRPDIVDYVRTVIEQRTRVHHDTTADRLARGLVTSILNRLGAGYSIASGQARAALAPAGRATP